MQLALQVCLLGRLGVTWRVAGDGVDVDTEDIASNP